MHFHIIWTTYGTWLPGDERGWLRKGDPAVQLPDPDLRRICADRMRGEVVLLDDDQRRIVTETITAHYQLRGWALLALAVKVNHVHVVIAADRDGNVVRDQFKAWCSRHLSDHAGLTQRVTKHGGRRRWFTEGGYVRVIEDDDYLRSAIAYVQNQSDSSRIPS